MNKPFIPVGYMSCNIHNFHGYPDNRDPFCRHMSFRAKPGFLAMNKESILGEAQRDGN